MKIVEVQAIRADRSCYAKIITDKGIHGIGESGVFGVADTVAAQIRSSGPYLVGKNPLDIEHHWQVMSRGMFFRGAAAMGALSAVDMALWDTVGKYYNAPVYQPTDGKCRDKVPVYGHVIASSDEELVENCKKREERGFKALGHLSPFLDEDKDAPYNRTYTKNMEGAIWRTHLMRETVGDDVDLCIELHRRSLSAEAVVLIREVADVHPLFVEDPIPPGSNEAMVYVVRHSKVSITTGEWLHTIYGFQDLLDRQVANYIRIGLTTVGGLTDARKVTTLAESKMRPIVPYNPLNPVCTAAEMQLRAYVGNLLICEYPSGDDRLSWDSTSTDRKCDMVTNWGRPVDGYITPSSAPGIGTDLMPDIEKHFPPITYALGSRLNIDGSIRDR